MKENKITREEWKLIRESLHVYQGKILDYLCATPNFGRDKDLEEIDKLHAKFEKITKLMEKIY